MIRAILMDIEGTTSSIDFVKKTLFPYAYRHLPAFVRAHAESPDCAEQIAMIAETIAPDASLDEVIATCLQWIEEDRKATPLKVLQGLIWSQGYHSGALVAHIYPDVSPMLRHWQAEGLGLYVYSSGSRQAQKLFFSHSEAGDLGRYFSDYFDTTMGAKSDIESYRRIASAMNHPAAEILFLSDVPAELDAAAASGMQTCQLVRPGFDADTTGRHRQVRNFHEIDWV